MSDTASSAARVAPIDDCGMWAVDLGTGAWIWSNEFKAVLGVPRTRRAGWDAFLEQVHPEDAAMFASKRGERPAAIPDRTFRVRPSPEGDARWLRTISRMLPTEAGRPGQIIGMVQDITNRRRAEIERDASELRLNTVLKIGRMVVWDLDMSSGIVTRSANAEEVIGVRREPITDFVKRVHPDDRHMVSWESSDNPSPPSVDVRFRYVHPNGQLLWLESAAIKVEPDEAAGHIVGITMDVTMRQSYEEKLIFAANHDPLTGLLNRKAWRAAVDEAVLTAGERRPPPIAILLLDVDHFKIINDSLGHDIGDAVLQSVGERLRAGPHVFCAARLGGDEFAACLDTVDPHELLRVGRRLLGDLSDPIRLGDRTVAVGASIGIATFPAHGTTAADLVKNADLALYAAKHAGRGHARLFEPPMRAALDTRLLLETEFAAALDAGQIVPFYQPKVDLGTGRPVGFEALARWLHPTRGVLTPGTFGAVFDNGDLAGRLGRLMRRAVVADLRSWRAAGLDVGSVAINCSAHDFRTQNLNLTILDEWTGAGLPPDALVIEVTEGVILGRHADAVATTLHRLHAAGARISLDDFGTGYASLVHLKHLPVDEIKLDRSFLENLGQPADAAIIQAVLTLGTSLRVSTVGEGVETSQQADALRAMGCRLGQGYLFGKPMSASRVPWFVRGGYKRSRPSRPPQAAAG